MSKSELYKFYQAAIILICIFTFPIASSGQSIAINHDGSPPDSSAILDIKSTTSGLLIPRMTTVERTTIPAPATGLMVYDTETHSFWCYAGPASWVEVVSGAVALVADADNDTKIQVEESPDEDIIRFDVAGSERWVMKGTSLEPKNTGGSLFVGSGAGMNDDGTDNNNTFLGDSSGLSNTIGFCNTAIGFRALQNNTEGKYNTAIGFEAMNINTTGWLNTAVGREAMASNTTGKWNTAYGGHALWFNTIGDNNTAIGFDALLLRQNGQRNTAIGVRALGFKLNGNNNTAVGFTAGLNNDGDGNVFIGHSAGANATGSNKLYIDNTDTNIPLVYGEFDNDVLAINGKLGVGPIIIPTGYRLAVAGKTFSEEVGIGTSSIPTGYRLAVDGKIIGEEVRVELSGNWPDYVFKPDYTLMPLEDLEKSIRINGHLPGMPSAFQVEAEAGIDIGEMNLLLLEKIEELTLYIIEQQKKIDALTLRLDEKN